MSSSLTRRELLRRGAGAAGAALLLPAAAGAQSPVPPPPDPARMLKAVSLIGLANPYDDGYGVRPYLLGGAHPTDVVTMWINWAELQPVRPEPFTLAQSFRDLGDPAGPGAAALAALDARIALANADGRRVALCAYQSFPSWSHAASALPGQGRLPDDARLPDDLGEDGPWAWFVAWTCARYADAGGVKTPGPGRDGSPVGNPAAARVDWLQPMNEPNLAWWPQVSTTLPDGEIASAVARMMRTAATVAARYRNGDALPRGPELLMPNTADVVQDGSDRGTPWRTFTTDVLRHLSGWVPETPVGWSQHNYYDVKYGPQTEGPARGRWRAEETVALLRAAGWPDPAVWLTEGGYQFDVRRASARPNHYVVDPTETADPQYPDAYAEQAAKLERNWRAMAALPVRMWTQYLVNDFDVHFQSSLRGPLRTAPDGTAAPQEPPYPAYALWPTLTA
ncbi:hypothetical protein [Conexibacter woesei]|uniref:Uncharacterized protein n=1 Tax=Conexibacter woesei (strain DSM 14684 / CCUG 47730 / CIP 108061 / JCM 11494 / NBRC 100937 / ID131577) TaxID=469383 RepID=D3F2X4_CONWI|nr:hypothetical protein [Conexibacter woesei]ADB54255.1 hypothetical protein Cwoe_5855 [Conexibacter woesei DSM 14684]